MDKITEASRLAVRQLNNMVWSLDTHNDYLSNLLGRMRDYTYEVLGLAGLEATFDFPTGLPDHRLPVLLRRNFYLIYRESLHNVLKHATGAAAVAVSLRYMAGSLPHSAGSTRQRPRCHCHPSRTRSPLGPWPRNMATRAEALGGVATAGPVPGGGFRIQMAMPLASLHRAFGLKKSA